jgi:hypothetical protein
MRASRALRVALCLAPLGLASCIILPKGDIGSSPKNAAEDHDALAVSDALEARIAKGEATEADREFAYQAVLQPEYDTAAYAFARAAVTGRLVQQRGLRGARLVGEVERWAMRSRELDPDFRRGGATRLLGTLYVIAPASFVEHGDSERGVELLEGLVEEYPEDVENHLRLAEAYIALGDPEPAVPHLCACVERFDEMRPDDQQLLAQLVAVAGAPRCADHRDEAD